MYGLYGLKHHTVEMLPCGTGRRTREDKATQPLDDGRLSFAKTMREINSTPLVSVEHGVHICSYDYHLFDIFCFVFWQSHSLGHCFVIALVNFVFLRCDIGSLLRPHYALCFYQVYLNAQGLMWFEMFCILPIGRDSKGWVKDHWVSSKRGAAESNRCQ